MVAYFNLVDYVSNPKVLQCIDVPDHTTLMSPFQLAIKQGHIEMVKALLPLSKMEHLDINSNSVFHYAASTTKEIINVSSAEFIESRILFLISQFNMQLLTANNTVNLNHLNADGYTPLHLACVTDKPDNVKMLLLAGADVNLNAKNISKLYKTSTPTSVASFLRTNASKLYTQDMKYGGTPLHWCSSRETLHALIMEGCDVNATNFDGRTALHVMVARNRFECVVTLLAHDADIDVLDNEGNSALHIAIGKKLVPIVQCLVVFGCDINLKNKDGRTPRHMVGNDTSGNKDDEILYILHSVGAKRCLENSSKCPPGCNAKGNYNGIPPEAPESVEQREHIENMLAVTSRQVVGGFLNAAANGALEKQAPPQ